MAIRQGQLDIAGDTRTPIDIRKNGVALLPLDDADSK
jgi:hypothetical protein